MAVTLRLEDPRFVASGTSPDNFPPPSYPEIAFAGRSNVGKSSLLNTLLGRPLARTSSTPGRTRLVNFFAARLPGAKGKREVGLVDLPGYGYAKVARSERAAWQHMIEGYVTGRPTLRAMVVIVDVRRGAEAEERDLLEWLAALPLPSIVVGTKLDKLGKAAQKPALVAIGQELGMSRSPLGFSAETGEGKADLIRLLSRACETE
ncbi:MAG: YihA family ribosome biogenesis GTP-binding protein [Deltaproteobacteria bacterium]|nr:YihA family ribosome biogenesis GTP-binding protein [Deltaproteobacteria bacterium]